MKIKFFIWVIFLVFSCATSCSPDDTPPNEISKPVVGEAQKLVSGKIELIGDLSGEDLTISTPTDEFVVAPDGTYEATVNQMDKKVLFIENKNEVLFYAALVKSEVQNINAETTAEAMIALMPWTAHTEFEELLKMLSDIKEKSGFNVLTSEISKSIENEVSPLENTAVLQALEGLFSFETRSFSSSKIPEVDYTVEPRLSYANGILTIKNDGTTTAAWGVEVIQDAISLTEELVLPGNKVHFPSFASFVDYYVNNDASQVVFTSGESLQIPLGVDGKFEINFSSPWSPNLFTSSLSREAAKYNFLASYETILKSFGIDINLSSIYDRGCVNSIFDGSINTLVNAIREDKLTEPFFLKEAYSLLSSSVSTISACSEMWDNFPGSTISSKEKYLRKALKFLDAYSKLETVFITSKLFGDMALLNDFKICRQVLESELFPCFTILKNPTIDGTILEVDETIRLEVKTQLDIPPADNDVFPVGAKIYWKVLEGDGFVHSDFSVVGEDGLAEVWFTAGEEEKHIIIAYTRGANGQEIERVQYELIVGNPLVGIWDWVGSTELQPGEKYFNTTYDCPSVPLSWEVMYGMELNFTLDKFSLYMDEEAVFYHIDLDDNCNIIEDEPDTVIGRRISEIYGSYTFKDGILTLTYDEGSNPDTYNQNGSEEEDVIVVKFLNEEGTIMQFGDEEDEDEDLSVYKKRE